MSTVLLRPPPTRHPAATAAPVRVCFLIDELATAGTEMQLLALLRRLDRTRIEPYLCLLRGTNASSRALAPTDCPVIRLGVGSLARPATIRKVFQFARFLRASDIEVFQAFFPDSCYFGLLAAWLAGVPHRVRTRNNLGHWLTRPHRLLGRLLNRITTCSVTNCHAAAEALVAAEGAPPKSVMVLENGVDLERFNHVPPLRMPGPGEPVRIGIIANLRAVKGVDLLIEAAAQLSAEFPAAHFEVAGEGEERQELEARIAAHNLQGRFVLRGGISEIPSFLRWLHIAVLCSHAEGMSNALLEYMAAGRAVVATAVGAAPELIEDEQHGLLVCPGDAEALAAAIARLLHEPGLAEHLGRAARARIWHCYSREAMVQRFEEFYERLTGR
jgi:glycosyltransferase involved in cell wall biosynthesis